MSIKLDSELREELEEKKSGLEQDWTLPFNAISVGDDHVLTIASPPPESKHQFAYEDVTVHFHVTTHENSSTCRLWAPICVMPYTAEAPNTRKSIFEILKGARELTTAKFVVENDQRILAMYENEIEGHCTLDTLMLEILAYLQQVKPFIALLRQRASIK